MLDFPTLEPVLISGLFLNQGLFLYVRLFGSKARVSGFHKYKRCFDFVKFGGVFYIAPN
jgi:hypothetical protein